MPLVVRCVSWPVEQLPSLLERADVVVCTSTLQASDAELGAARATLSAAEQERGGAIANGVVARRFVIGRALLRAALADALGELPEMIDIRTGVHGKPYLSVAEPAMRLWFSVAHTDDLFICALSRRGEVGVDVERVREMPNWRRVAERVLHHDALHPVRGTVRDCPSFLGAWCRVEAQLKANGTGIVGLDAHRTGRLDETMKVADVRDLVLPTVLAEGRYCAAVALRASPPSHRQAIAPTIDMSAPTRSPASASTP